MRESITPDELHGLFMQMLAEQRPGSRFVLDVDACEPVGGGCNWFPLASMAAWQGDVTENLAAFRRVRELLSERYDILPAGHAAPAAASAAGGG